jgi:uncharacterized protein (DUF4415 family)
MATTRKTLAQIQNELQNPSQEDIVRWENIKHMLDSDIDYSDIDDFLADPDFWKHATLIKKPTKKQISFRIDSDVLEGFKKQGKGYQTLMNRVLKSYLEHLK